MKILTIIGARPQFIKAAATSKAISNHNSSSLHKIDEVIVHTGQHYDKNMSSIFFDQLEIKHPEYTLESGGKNHNEMTASILLGLDKILIKEMPDAILVYGDTTSTIAGVLSGTKNHIPCIHIEAGLRSNNLKMPEEINRIVADRLSSLLLCPTEIAIKNLNSEGFPFPALGMDSQVIELVGDVMFDIYKMMEPNFNTPIKNFNLLAKDYCLVTAHRQEITNSKKSLSHFVSELEEVSKSGLKIFWPIHPGTKKSLANFNITLSSEYFIAAPPLSYFDVQSILKSARCVITDSGGLQKEAFFAKIPCITPRSETEWIETLKYNFNQLHEIGGETSLISKVEQANQVSFFDADDFLPFGDGTAAIKIVQAIIDKL